MKKNVIYIIITLIILASLFTLSSCRKYSKETDPHKYLRFELLDDDTYAVTGFTNRPVEKLTIPATHNDKPVTTVKAYAFKMPKGIWGGNRRLPVKKLVIEDGIKIIEKEAFYQTGLEETILPNSIEYIGDSAFAYNVTSINLPENLSYVGKEALYRTKLSGEIFIKNIEIGSGAFADTAVNKVVFDDDIKIIKENIFSSCTELNEVILPKNLKEIERYAFFNTEALESIEFPDSLEVIGRSAFEKSGLTTLTLASALTIQELAFSNNNNLTTIYFLDENINLEYGVFRYCENLDNIYFSNMKSIKATAFIGAPLRNLSVDEENSLYKIHNGGVVFSTSNGYELILGSTNFNNFDNIVTIGDYALAGRSFDNLFIGKNVKMIKPYAFYYAEIENADINSDTIGNYAFYYASISGDLSISSRVIKSNSFYFAKNFKILRINEGTEIIEREAFVVNEMEKVYLSASLKIIEIAAFIQCHYLKEVYYELKEGTPVNMYAGNFIIYISSLLTEDKRINVKINEDFKIYVYEEIYDEAIKLWSKLPTNEKYIYHSNLVDHIEKR